MSAVTDRTRNPLVRLRDAIWRPTPGSVRALALFSVIVNAGIIVTGGAVRLTKSGLGCSTWPKCTPESMIPTSSPDHSPVHMAIEFGNRTLTFLVLGAAVAVLTATWRSAPRRRDLVLLAALQPAGVVAQALWGGLTVLSDLHPAVVAGHFMLSPVVLVPAVALWVRAGEGDEPARRLVGERVRALTLALVAATAALMVAGTVVTGTGPHAGDDRAERFSFEIVQVTRVHSLLAWLTVALTATLVVALWRTGAPAAVRRRALEALALELAQGAIGYVQYFLGVPEILVALHMLGAAVLWIAVLRVCFATRTRGPLVVPGGAPAPAGGPVPQPA
ncbi:COX15/CtaA family protein [Thermomonospora catenispora]|uniref:COX15/CtaA family protein n=1 Tax=Thermomonospora catenispora TaxID=2493090 RepID=UPI0011217A10|nr:COX15/CtaA family protein [Thermomonospora catenispora]TNY37370.1 heme A synthase [Thermomonospora catenispora]